MKKYLKVMSATALCLGLGLTIAACGGESAAPVEYEPGELSGTDPDYATKMADCLKESGWEVEVVPGGSFTIDFAGEDQEAQIEAYEAAREACSDDLGYDEPLEELSDSDRKRLYDGLVSLAECLQAEGYEIRDIPSEQAYLDETGVFDPYGELRDPGRVGSLSDEEYSDLLKVCPEP